MELNPHATELTFHTPVPANKMECQFWYIVLRVMLLTYTRAMSHDSILEMWRTFPNAKMDVNEGPDKHLVP